MRVPAPSRGRPYALVLALAAVIGAAAPVGAQSFPTRPVRVIVPYPAGGAVDLVGRMIAQKMTEDWPHPAVVENRPGGANGNLGAELVVNAPPDGHTLLVSSAGVFTTNRLLYRDMSFDPRKDLAPVSIAITAPNVLVASPKLPVTDLRGFLAYAAAHPGKVNYASQGNGSTGHLTGAALGQAGRLELVHVPYRGSAPAMADLLAGNVQIAWDTITTVLPHVKAGTIRALAVGSPARAPSLPDAPTAQEAGLPGFESVAWYAVATSAATPPALVAKLAEGVARAMRDPATAAKLTEMGAQPVGGTPDEMRAYLEAETARWSRVIEGAAIKID